MHQCKRLNLPYFLITNHDASLMPNYYTTVNGVREKLKFDRILADVPCTGDGTLRKNADIWNKWNAANANNLHFIQLRIARRAVELLANDGLMVYSTCSLNPVENEVVIMNLLRQADGALELVDVEDKLKHLKHINGLEKWTIMQRDSTVLNSIDDADENYKKQINNNMFTPSNVEKYNLKRCVRILPHQNNTGGFFIAVLKKVKPLPWVKSEEIQNECDETENLEQNAKRPRLETKDKRAYGFKENPFNFVTKEDEGWLKIKEFFSISDDFPAHRLFYRSEKGLNHLYYTTESASDLYKHNADRVKVKLIFSLN